MALGKAASQSGSWVPYSTADKAVDGNTDSNMGHKSCVHPGKLDLKKKSFFKRIIFTTTIFFTRNIRHYSFATNSYSMAPEGSLNLLAIYDKNSGAIRTNRGSGWH